MYLLFYVYSLLVIFLKRYNIPENRTRLSLLHHETVKITEILSFAHILT